MKKTPEINPVTIIGVEAAAPEQQEAERFAPDHALIAQLIKDLTSTKHTKE